MTRALAATAVATLLLAACSSSSTSSGGAAAPSGAATGEVTIQLTEFQFLMPDEIPAGVQTLHVENIGGMPHFIDFQQVQGTHTDDEIQALVQDPKAKQPSWLTPAPMPGISLLSSGQSADIAIDLPPGTYAAFCWMPDAKGQPHALDGMHHVFTVTGDPAGAFGSTDFTVTWDGTTFDGAPDTLPAGSASIAYENTGSKPGQLNVIRVLEDAPFDQIRKDVNGWFQGLYAGPPPVAFTGGLSNVQSDVGVLGTVSVDFVDGVYALVGPGKSEPAIITVGAGSYPSPSASMAPATCTPDGTSLSLTASASAFNTTCLAAPAGQAFTIAFDNQDASVPHDVAIYPEGDGTKAVFTGDLVTGVAGSTYQVPALDAGTYRFQCDVHPATMNGTFIVS